MQVRLTLKKAYTWPSKYPDRPNSNDYGFVQIPWSFELGEQVSFEQLNATFLAGDLNINHYKYFEGKSYIVTRHKNGFLNLIEIDE